MNERPRQVRLRPLIDQALRNNRDLRLRELDERLVLARQIIAIHLESLRIFRRRVEAGSTSRLDLPQVETLLQQALALGRQPAQERAIRTNGLVLLVGEPVYFGPPHQLDDAEAVRIIRVELLSELLIQRPDIVAAEHHLKAAYAQYWRGACRFFNGGRNRSNLEVAEVRRMQAVAVYERTTQNAFLDDFSKEFSV